MRGSWKSGPTASKTVVEIGRYEFGGYAIRNSAFRARTIVLTKSELVAFLNAVKMGVFDDLVEVRK